MYSNSKLSSNRTNSPYFIGVDGRRITSIQSPYGPLNSSFAQSPAGYFQNVEEPESALTNCEPCAQFGASNDRTSTP
jgi:hypothetical protein